MQTGSPQASVGFPSSIDLPTTINEPTTTILNGKEVKVVIKEVHKHTAACEACRARKRKCEGQAPCSYCAAKQIQCVFAPQRKRGPSAAKRKRIEEEPSTTLGAARYESEILDMIEANNFNNFYGRFVQLILPISTTDIMRPSCITHKTQSYVALAYIARISGSCDISQKYISQARVLSGSIYDSPDIDAASAMMMFASYWKLVNDETMGRFYLNLAVNIAGMVPEFKLAGKTGTFIKVMRAMMKFSSEADRLRLSGEMRQAALELIPDTKDNLVCKTYVNIAADMLNAIPFSIIGPDARTLELRFRVFDDVVVSEEARSFVQKTVTDVHNVIDMCADYDSFPQLKLLHSLECPLYLTVIDLLSGHTVEGVNHAYGILAGLQQLKDNNATGVLAELPLLFMLGGVCRKLHLIGNTSLALQLFEFVKLICKVMTPEYNFVLVDTEFSADGLPATDPIFGPARTSTIYITSPNIPYNANNFPATFGPTNDIPNNFTTFLDSCQTPSPPNPTTFVSVSPTSSPDIPATYIQYSPTFTSPQISPIDAPLSIPPQNFATMPQLDPASFGNTLNATIPNTYSFNSLNFEEIPVQNDDLENILHAISGPDSSS